MRKVILLIFIAVALAANAAAQSGRRLKNPPTPVEPVTEATTVAQPDYMPVAPSELSGLPESLLTHELKSVDQGSFRLADFSGKVIVVNLWATWCGRSERDSAASGNCARRPHHQPLARLFAYSESGPPARDNRACAFGSVGTEPGAVATGSRHPTAFATESEALAKGFGAKQTVDPTIVTRSVETDVSLLLQTASCCPIASGQRSNLPSR